MSRQLNRIVALALIGLVGLAASGCSSGSGTAEVGNAICRNYTEKILSASQNEDPNVARVEMLVAHLDEASDLGRLDDPRIKQMARAEAAIARFVRKSVSGAPTDVELPDGWESAYHRTWLEIGLEDCASRGSEYPGAGIEGTREIPAGTPPDPSAAPIPGYTSEIELNEEASGPLFRLEGSVVE